ncbi:MAG: galactose mutarotase [Muribaculaceae bacterium]|nr:galactose mutarotase [Muribaculaceae bacterium]
MLSTRKAASPLGDITLVTITNASGASVVLSTLGAGIVEVNVPDRSGKLADVVLGYADAADYIADGPCAGKVPGRYANRIARGHLEIDGKVYSLPVNNGPNHLHGGPEGFQNRIWELVKADGDTVVMSYTAADGEAGYPGKLTATATYRWTDACELCLTLSATTDAATVVNLTNHAYWNLAGHNAGAEASLAQTLWLKASRYLPTDDTLIPEGVLVPVEGCPMDFTTAKALGRDIKLEFPALIYGKGYDNCWAIDDYAPGKVQTVAVLSDAASGRTLTVDTDQPGVQIYTGNWLAGSPANKAGRPYEDYDGVAIECQDFPDAPNVPAFPGVLLRPGSTYTRHINFKFTAN